jgi:hypothetical protein
MFLCHRSEVNILKRIDFQLQGQRKHQHHQQWTHYGTPLVTLAGSI